MFQKQLKNHTSDRVKHDQCVDKMCDDDEIAGKREPMSRGSSSPLPLPSTTTSGSSSSSSTSPESPLSDEEGYHSGPTPPPPQPGRQPPESEDIDEQRVARERELWLGSRLTTGQLENFNLDAFRREKEEYKRSFRENMERSIHKIHGDHREMPRATCDATTPEEPRRKRDPHRQHLRFQAASNKYARMENTAEELELPGGTIPTVDTKTSTRRNGKPLLAKKEKKVKMVDKKAQ